MRRGKAMEVGRILTGSGVLAATGTSSSSSIQEQSASSQSNIPSFASVLNQISLNNEGQSTYLIRHTGNIGSTIDIFLDNNGKINLTANELCNAFKTQTYVEIKSSDLNPAGQKYQDAHNCESIV
jgi:hypothetical protein